MNVRTNPFIRLNKNDNLESQRNNLESDDNDLESENNKSSK